MLFTPLKTLREKRGHFKIEEKNTEKMRRKQMKKLKKKYFMWKIIFQLLYLRQYQRYLMMIFFHHFCLVFQKLFQLSNPVLNNACNESNMVLEDHKRILTQCFDTTNCHLPLGIFFQYLSCRFRNILSLFCNDKLIIK